MQTELALSSPPIAGLPFHTWDFIYAHHPKPGERPEWYTEKKFPLRSDLVEQGTYLYGVRFGKKTQYAMLDIDAGSAFHPKKDPFAIRQICEALEPLGLVRSLICQSSTSGGLHIYFPWAGEALKSYQVGLVISVLLQRNGFQPAPGHLEIFPNAKAYRGKETPSLYNAHRLPLQRGFYLLDEDFQPLWTTQHKFIACWQSAAQANIINKETQAQLLKQLQRRQYPVSTSAEKFLNDLHAAIEPGWERTEDHPPFHWQGQEGIIPKTNQLLGRIAIREYVFFHIDGRHPPLEGDALIERIVTVATNLPGYKEHCQHQHEIRKRAAEWARSVENSHYFHYGIKKKTKAAPVEVAWHDQKAQAARDKITDAIVNLLTQGTLPSTATNRAKALVEICHTSMRTLYKNKDLWHPAHLLTESNSRSAAKPDEKEGCLRPVKAQQPNQKNLLGEENGNNLTTQVEQEITGQQKDVTTATCGNSEYPSVAAPSLNQDMAVTEHKCATESVSETIQRVKQLLRLQEKQREAAAKIQDHAVEAQIQTEQQQHYQTQLRQWLTSGDPILTQEAQARLADVKFND